jgi:hypothetical protein
MTTAPRLASIRRGRRTGPQERVPALAHHPAHQACAVHQTAPRAEAVFASGPLGCGNGQNDREGYGGGCARGCLRGGRERVRAGAGRYDLIKFVAAGSTGQLVAQSRARFCGATTGKYSYSNSGGGTSHAVQMVGMFRVPENLGE